MSQTKQNENTFAGIVSLDEVTRSWLMDWQYGMERYEQGKHWIIEGYRDFHFDQAREVKTVQLSLTPWKSVQWPDDMVDWCMIGIVFNQQIRCFTNDSRISLYLPDQNPIDGLPDTRTGSNSEPDYSEVSSKYWFYNYDSRWMDKGKLFGLAVKGNGQGEFKPNRERREFQFDIALDSVTPIYLEYISNGVTVNGKTVVNVYAAKLLKRYADWCKLKYSKSANQAEIQRAENDYYREMRLVQSRLNPITVEDVIEAARDAYHLTPVY